MARARTRVQRTVGRINVALYRASGGRIGGRVMGLPVLLLTLAGRRSGTLHTTPVSYLPDGDRYVVTGSGGGSASEPQWFRNLRAASVAEIEVGARKLTVSVSIADGPDRDALWQTLTARTTNFAKYQAKVDRQIPMAVLTPRT